MEQEQNNAQARERDERTITPTDDEATGRGTGSAVGSYGGPADATEDDYPTSDSATAESGNEG